MQDVQTMVQCRCAQVCLQLDMSWVPTGPSPRVLLLFATTGPWWPLVALAASRQGQFVMQPTPPSPHSRTAHHGRHPRAHMSPGSKAGAPCAPRGSAQQHNSGWPWLRTAHAATFTPTECPSPSSPLLVLHSLDSVPGQGAVVRLPSQPPGDQGELLLRQPARIRVLVQLVHVHPGRLGPRKVVGQPPDAVRLAVEVHLQRGPAESWGVCCGGGCWLSRGWPVDDVG